LWVIGCGLSVLVYRLLFIGCGLLVVVKRLWFIGCGLSVVVYTWKEQHQRDRHISVDVFKCSVDNRSSERYCLAFVRQ